MTTPPKRTGARRVADVPADVRDALNRGEMATANLVECLAVDQLALANHVLSPLGLAAAVEMARDTVAASKRATAPQLVLTVGRAIAAARPKRGAVKALATHRSDVVRCWAAVAVARLAGPRLFDQFAAVRPFATDPHFGVREEAWLAVRDGIAEQPLEAIELLVPWAAEADPNLRRFASEATRPRGVWARHINALKADPRPGLLVLEPLRADGSKYVRDSVANWLNDAAKSAPGWVREVCGRWERESPVPETLAILRRARRNLA